ncbi:MAG: DUF1549 and DUF1553 domain-containing protein [Planctomycetes bacterium]|nr:DUF1549 and DUF1553 domain-containing protein [Planctomycetota bacterium]
MVLSVAAASRAQETQPAAGEAFTTGSSDAIIQFINERIRQGWQDNEIRPSEVAGDPEWLRRAYLDIVGHIPPAEAVEAFLGDKDKTKRSKVVEKLLDDPGYVRNWQTVWTNLAIGRGTPDRVSRVGMEKFFREAFFKNRPWNEVVFDLVSAEGHFVENGAVNFLLAQIEGGNPNDPEYAVTATAKTTRLFLGLQVQCTQCHNHPFNDWKQDQFWEFNTFFRQARREDYQKYDPQSGRMVDDYSELVRFNNVEGPVYYEKRSGLMQVAYPRYFDAVVDPSADVNRREELAKLMTRGEQPLIATAMVNRMWGHFFGYGFTKPVDDMGPHNPPSHPELLDRLASEFVKANYDLKQLIRWIANSEAYNLTSSFGKHNEIDNPAAGETPLFSHMYVKSMSAEQLYDSLIVATDAHKAGRSNWEEAQRQRQQWMQQFVIAFDTDENDESTTFNGTIPQALMMMNGPLVESAISINQGSYLRSVLEDPRTNAVQKVEKLYLSSIGRKPTRNELAKAQQLIKTYSNQIEGYQDLFWALLNSNEFIFVH